MAAMAKQQPEEIDAEYPGTAVVRMRAAVERAKQLTAEALSGDWEDARRRVLWAAGLRDLPNAQPGRGYTGHSFNDWNHCDATTMSIGVAHNENEGQVAGIAFGNPLGAGIQIASLPELGPGGTWSTCMQGCHVEPPRDVAHVQFRSRIAFKLVWCPPQFESFVLVDDHGERLAYGEPTGQLPAVYERQQNYTAVRRSKYAVAAEAAAAACAQADL